jgi:hypothetical protein
MNSAGDMLRVATNVIGDDGKRGVGTYVPAVGADGQPNAMVSTVLRGETFVGRAFVLNGWYMAAYEPLLNSDKSVMGMLYVGVPEASATEVLRRTLIDTKVGTTGYVIVLNATGATRGHYVVSRGGKRDGEEFKGQQRQSLHTGNVPQSHRSQPNREGLAAISLEEP